MAEKINETEPIAEFNPQTPKDLTYSKIYEYITREFPKVKSDDEAREIMRNFNEGYNLIIEAERISDIREITQERALAVVMERKATKGQPVVFRNNYDSCIDHNQKKALVNALTPAEDGSFEQESFALYHDNDHWNRVSEAPEYREAKKDLELMFKNITEIIKIFGHHGAKELTLSDLGPGDGYKILEIILNKILVGMRKGNLKLGDETLRKITIEPIDVNKGVLQSVVSNLLMKIVILIKNARRQHLGENHPWKSFIDFITKHNKKDINYTNDYEKYYTPSDTVRRLMEGEIKWDDNRKPVDSYVKYLLSRYFHFLEHYDEGALEELRNEVEVPLEIRPILINFENMNFKQFHATNDNAKGIMHLGDEVCNGFIDDKIAELYPDICGKAVPIDKKAYKQNPDDETNIRATYIAFSLQTSHFDTPGLQPEELEPEHSQIKSAYDNTAMNMFVAHLFDNNYLCEFYNPETGEDYWNHPECYDLEADFCEDPDHPGYYGSFHHLVFNKDIGITITVDGKVHNIVMKKGQKIKLLSSYKPTFDQVKAACEELHLKVVTTYQDEEKTNAVVVIRAMTHYEKKLKMPA